MQNMKVLTNHHSRYEYCRPFLHRCKPYSGTGIRLSCRLYYRSAIGRYIHLRRSRLCNRSSHYIAKTMVCTDRSCTGTVYRDYKTDTLQEEEPKSCDDSGYPTDAYRSQMARQNYLRSRLLDRNRMLTGCTVHSCIESIYQDRHWYHLQYGVSHPEPTVSQNASNLLQFFSSDPGEESLQSFSPSQTHRCGMHRPFEQRKSRPEQLFVPERTARFHKRKQSEGRIRKTSYLLILLACKDCPLRRHRSCNRECHRTSS